jgi:hypothetical protein
MAVTVFPFFPIKQNDEKQIVMAFNTVYMGVRGRGK